MNKRWVHISVLLLFITTLACTSGRKLTGDFYRLNATRLESIRDRFKKLHSEQGFSIEMKDKEFTMMGLEILSDSIRYVYTFDLITAPLTDTLKKYNFNVAEMNTLISDMRSMKCNWITNLDYYESQEKKFLVFLSLRHQLLGTKRKEKYFTLAFFEQAQYYDDKQRLLDKEGRKELRKINNEIFYRITDRVYFTLAGEFR